MLSRTHGPDRFYAQEFRGNWFVLDALSGDIFPNIVCHYAREDSARFDALTRSNQWQARV